MNQKFFFFYENYKIRIFKILLNKINFENYLKFLNNDQKFLNGTPEKSESERGERNQKIRFSSTKKRKSFKSFQIFHSNFFLKPSKSRAKIMIMIKITLKILKGKSNPINMKKLPHLFIKTGHQLKYYLKKKNR